MGWPANRDSELGSSRNGIENVADQGAKNASLWHPTGLGGRIGERTMKRAVPVRMPKWPEGHFPNSKQLQTYLLFWERQRKPLEPDPGAGLYQKSFWLDPEDLDVDAYEAECFRGVRLDRAQFIRRIVATYHKIPAPLVAPKVVTTSGEVASRISLAIASTRRQAFRAVPTRGNFSEKELSPAEVNEISGVRGLGICWQPGNAYRMGRTASGKSCLVQVDARGTELAKYGSW
jgi:hypothetical protein